MNYEEVREDMDAIEVYENVEDFLSHHGIKGMSWGVQNGPPYPLSAGEHKKVIDKAKVKAAAEKAGEATKKAVKKTAEATKATVNKIKEHREEKKAEEREEKIKSVTSRTSINELKEFSDEELARIETRVKTMQRIQQAEQPTIKKGESAVKKILKDSATDTFKDVVTATSTTKIEQLLGLKSDKDTASLIREEFSRLRKSSRSGGKKYTEEELAKAIEKALKEQENDSD